MIKYLELEYPNGDYVLIKMDSIKEVSISDNGNALINGFCVKQSYEEIKKLITQEERRTCYELQLNPVTKCLMRNPIWQLVKEFGETKAIDFIREVMDDCFDEEDAYRIEKKYYQPVSQPEES